MAIKNANGTLCQDTMFEFKESYLKLPALHISILTWDKGIKSNTREEIS